jgi:hypothetical protein
MRTPSLLIALFASMSATVVAASSCVDDYARTATENQAQARPAPMSGPRLGAPPAPR